MPCIPPGFTISLYEYEETIKTLWDAVKGEIVCSVISFEMSLTPFFGSTEFGDIYPQHIPAGNSLKFISDDGGET